MITDQTAGHNPSNSDPPSTSDPANRGADTSQPQPRTHNRSVHIRGVPEAVWRRARTNALLSGLPFKEYVTLLLAYSDPIPVDPFLQPDPEEQADPGEQAGPSATAQGALQ